MDIKKESEMFNQMADYYDRYRPGYPQEIINEIVGKADLRADSKLLEIGAGSGKATAQFSDFGFEMICIDPGEDLVKKGNDKFYDKNIKFVVSRFEDYSVPNEYFDAIISAQAFHWVPKPLGFEKCSLALKKGGFLFLFWNIEISKDTDFDRELLSIMEKFSAFTSSVPEADYENRMATISSEIAESGFFTNPKITLSHWEKTYTAEEYFGFVSTGNVFVQNSDDVKKACFEELKLLADKHGGIKRQYVCELYSAQKI
jgi:Methylase involved in ubiquinone/menaquinone biosynthesis